MLQVSDLTKRFVSGRGVVQALTAVSFSVETGTNLAIIGKSGSGKTTLLNCMGGLEKPDAGRVVLIGTDIHALSGKALSLFHRRQVGFLFQFGNLLSYLTVSENIAFPLLLNSVGKLGRERRVSELLQAIGLSDAGRALPHELSGGEVQRVAFARAIAHLPKILLADEPTASLDTATGTGLLRLMFGLSHDQKCTLVVTTHDQEVMKLADHTIRLKDGQIV